MAKKMAKKIGVVVAGLGRIGALHAEVFFNKVEGARLVAVMDIIEELAKSVAETYRVKAYTDYDKLLKDPEVDAVVICTPTWLHKDMIIKALEAGKHVFTEKPMTVTSAEADEVIAKLRKSGMKLQVGYMRRFDYAYSRAKKRIEEGEIGKPLTYIALARDPTAPPGWAADPSKSGGIFLDMLSHDFDMARFLMGSEVKKVHVEGGAYIWDEIKKKGDLDVVNINFEFENGALGFIHGTRKNTFGYYLRTEVYGTKGTIFVGAIADPIYSIGTEKGVVYYGYRWFMKRFYDAYVEEDKSFIKAILEDSQPVVNEDDGKKAVEIAEACWRSFKEKKPVALS